MKSVLKILLIAIINPYFLGVWGNLGTGSLGATVGLPFLMSFLQAMAIYFVVSNSPGLTRWTVFWRALIIFYGITYFQSGVEAYLFLNLMQDSMSVDQVYNMFLMGALSTLVMVSLATYLFREERVDNPSFIIPLKTTLTRISVLSFFYVVVYILFGIFVFMPIAGPHFDEFYGDLQPPPWALPFQLFRGLLWSVFAWMVMEMVSGSRQKVVFIITFMIAVPITSLLLPVNEILPGPIRLGHLIEVGSSMILFGWVSGMFLTKPLKKGIEIAQQG